MNKIAIINHVGKKSGMDIYDMSIASELNNNTRVFLLSNYGDVYKSHENIIVKDTFKVELEDGSIIGKIKYFFIGFIKALIYVKRKSIRTVIFHSFSYEYKDAIIFLIAKLLRLKILLVAHDISGFANNDKKFIKNAILKGLSTKVLVHNDFSKRELINYVSDKKIITIRLGGQVGYVKSINKQIALKKLKLDEGFKYILFFGQIKEVKGLDLLIKAFAKINNQKIKLIIAGKAWKEDFVKYHEIIEKLKLTDKIILHNRYILDEEKDVFFSAADLVVLPYKKIYQSGVLLTAMSYPALVLCSNLEPNKEIIKDGINGFLFKSSDIESLYKKMESIFLLEEKEIIEIKENALKIVMNEYSWQYTANKIESLIL